MKEGWEPLCKFLGKEIPKEEFPRVINTAQFKEIISLFNMIDYSILVGAIEMVVGTGSIAKRDFIINTKYLILNT